YATQSTSNQEEETKRRNDVVLDGDLFQRRQCIE
ncbi:hypothetical protein V3C99_003032, partial [Haemonchus contortus]